MVQHRERFVSRDVMADQITQRWCLQNPGLCLLQEEERLHTSSTVESCPTLTTSNPPTTTSNAQLGGLNFYLMIVIVSTFISANQ